MKLYKYKGRTMQGSTIGAGAGAKWSRNLKRKHEHFIVLI